MTSRHVGLVAEQLTDHDHRLVRDIAKYRLLTTKHIQRLHFDHSRATPLAAARACNRALTRLRHLNVVRTLERRVGGARAGSAGYVWYLGPMGEGLLRLLQHEQRGRRNYQEPSRHFVNHTLAITELATRTIEASRSGAFDLVQLETEPTSWQPSLTSGGTSQFLKPDLRLVTATADFEDHWFIEADLATEHLPVILRQCAAYTAFHATGRYQAAHGLFPAVLWVTPTSSRANAIQAALAAAKGHPPRLFHVCARDEFPTAIAEHPPP